MGTVPPNNDSGWYYTTTGNSKINWYYYASLGRNDSGFPTNKKLNQAETLYTIVRWGGGDFAGNLFLNLYTKRENDTNDAGTFYRSRITYISSDSLTLGRTYFIYYGEDPGIFPTLPRVELTMDTATTVGPDISVVNGEVVLGNLALEEEISSLALSSNSGAPTGISYTVKSLGSVIDSYQEDFLLEADNNGTFQNGLTEVGATVSLGGTLIQDTFITGDSANDINFNINGRTILQDSQFNNQQNFNYNSTFTHDGTITSLSQQYDDGGGETADLGMYISAEDGFYMERNYEENSVNRNQLLSLDVNGAKFWNDFGNMSIFNTYSKIDIEAGDGNGGQERATLRLDTTSTKLSQPSGNVPGSNEMSIRFWKRDGNGTTHDPYMYFTVDGYQDGYQDIIYQKTLGISEDNGLIGLNQYIGLSTDYSFMPKKYIDDLVSGSSASYSFTNGLTESGGTVKLGGLLTENTTIIGDINNGYGFNVEGNTVLTATSGYYSNILTHDSSTTSLLQEYDDGVENGNLEAYIQAEDGFYIERNYDSGTGNRKQGITFDSNGVNIYNEFSNMGIGNPNGVITLYSENSSLNMGAGGSFNFTVDVSDNNGSPIGLYLNSDLYSGSLGSNGSSILLVGRESDIRLSDTLQVNDTTNGSSEGELDLYITNSNNFTLMPKKYIDDLVSGGTAPSLQEVLDIGSTASLIVDINNEQPKQILLENGYIDGSDTKTSNIDITSFGDINMKINQLESGEVRIGEFNLNNDDGTYLLESYDAGNGTDSYSKKLGLESGDFYKGEYTNQFGEGSTSIFVSNQKIGLYNSVNQYGRNIGSKIQTTNSVQSNSVFAQSILLELNGPRFEMRSVMDINYPSGKSYFSFGGVSSTHSIVYSESGFGVDDSGLSAIDDYITSSSDYAFMPKKYIDDLVSSSDLLSVLTAGDYAENGDTSYYLGSDGFTVDGSNSGGDKTYTIDSNSSYIQLSVTDDNDSSANGTLLIDQNGILFDFGNEVTFGGFGSNKVVYDGSSFGVSTQGSNLQDYLNSATNSTFMPKEYIDDSISTLSSSLPTTTTYKIDSNTDTVLYSDSEISLSWDVSGSDIEIEILSNPTLEQVHLTKLNNGNLSAFDLQSSDGVVDIEGNMSSDDKIDLTIFAPSDSNYPHYRISIVRSNTLFYTNSPFLVIVEKWVTYN